MSFLATMEGRHSCRTGGLGRRLALHCKPHIDRTKTDKPVQSHHETHPNATQPESPSSVRHNHGVEMWAEFAPPSKEQTAAGTSAAVLRQMRRLVTLWRCIALPPHREGHPAILPPGPEMACTHARIHVGTRRQVLPTLERLQSS